MHCDCTTTALPLQNTVHQGAHTTTTRQERELGPLSDSWLEHIRLDTDPRPGLQIHCPTRQDRHPRLQGSELQNEREGCCKTIQIFTSILNQSPQLQLALGKKGSSVLRQQLKNETRGCTYNNTVLYTLSVSLASPINHLYTSDTSSNHMHVTMNDAQKLQGGHSLVSN